MSRSAIRLRAPAVCICLTMGLAACHPRESDPATSSGPPPERLCLVRPVLTNADIQASFDWLRKQFPGAGILPLSDAPAELEACRRENKTLLVPECSAFPVEAWAPLLDYLDRGGAAVFLGHDPFEQRVLRAGKEYVPEREWLRRVAETARDREGFSAVQLWQHANRDGRPRGAVRLAREAGIPGPGVLVETGDFSGWDALVLDPVPPNLFAAGEDTLVFYARGDERTGALAIECIAEDGSRWIHQLPLKPTWQLCVAHEGLFKPATDRSAGEPPPGSLQFARVRRIAIGLFNQDPPHPAGVHTFGLSKLRVAHDGRTAAEVTYEPDVQLLSPAYRYYEFAAREISADGSTAGQRWPAGPLQGPLPRSRGLGGESAGAWRWIPVTQGLDDQGEVRGWPVSIAVRPITNGCVSRIAWVGAPWTPRTRRVLAPALNECLTRFDHGKFLYRAGAHTFIFTPGDTLRVSSRWCSAKGGEEARIMAELVDPAGKALRRVVALPGPPDTPVDLNLGSLREEEDISEAVLRITLIDPRIPDRIYDRIEQPVKILARRAILSPDTLAVQGPFFARMKVPFFLAGVNYRPMSVNGRRPGEAQPHWLAASEFDPRLIVRDLDILVAAGVNAVAIQYMDEDQAPQLIFFLEEAAQRGIRVQVFLPCLHPLDHDLARAERLIAAAQLADQGPVVALDIAWKPAWGSYAERGGWDPEWRAWLTEQFGTLEQAERVLGPTLWRRDGKITGPPDESLTADGPDHDAVAVYRRFAADFISRRYGYIKRFLRGLGCRQLLGARAGRDGREPDRQMPFDLGAGAVHLDYIAPDGLGLTGTREQFLSAGFLTAYARGVSDGKPVAWMEYGCSVGPQPTRLNLDHQAEAYRNLLEMIDKSRAAACFAWWYPGGYLVDSQADFGIVNPDGTLRPAGRELQRFIHQQRFSSAQLAPWKGRELEVDADVRGLSALQQTWAPAYGQAMERNRMEEIRPYGFNQWTTEMPLLGPGGTLYTNPAPLACANAEWGMLWIQGEPLNRVPGARITANMKDDLEFELINTGPARWRESEEGVARAVWVRAEHHVRGEHWIKVPSTAFGKSCRIKWTPTDPGMWTLRPWLRDIGGFGESLAVDVAGAP